MNHGTRFNENNLVKSAKPYFKTARAGDWEHALRVVKWVKELGGDRDDLYLIITVAYLHDLGWSGIAPSGQIDLDEMLKLEPDANRNSPVVIRKVLEKMDFTHSEIEIVNRLVAAADRHESMQNDEEIIVDADSLSKLCVEHLKEKYQLKSYVKVIDLWEKELGKRIKTESGKKFFPNLLAQLKAQIATAKH